MVFFAYAKTNQDDATWRYIIVAPRMQVLDAWYRALSPKGVDLERKSPEFYTFNHFKIDLGRCTNPNGKVPEFMNKLIITLCDDVGGRQWHPFLNHENVDRISGNTFYIRSKSDPRVFWYDVSGHIYASQHGRTRFRVQNMNRSLDREVMIDSDSISISPVHNSCHQIAVDEDDRLCIRNHNIGMTLGDLKANFLASGSGEEMTVMRDMGNGEEWELVS